jgi:CheY-like chemotaxis protein
MFRILVVEDDHLLRGMLLRILEKFLGNIAPDIHLASHGIIGLEMHQQLCPDVVILDIGLPHKDGISVISEIRQIIPKQKIIATTSIENIACFAKQVGADYALVKPYSIKELSRLIMDINNNAD